MKTLKGLSFLVMFFFVITAVSLPAQQNQEYQRRFQNGSQLYNMGLYYEAAGEFRRAQELSGNIEDWAAAIYWVILSELAYSDYGSALLDMGELERRAASSVYNRDMAYHRARIYFNQGYFENSLLLFRKYIDSVTETGKDADDRRAAAFYWMGECLFAMGQLEDAQRFYSWVAQSYPDSPKREISSYRIELIKQKKIEAELLALLQWSHEESLRTSEDYQRRLRTYEYTLNAYQRRFTELTQGGGQTRESVQEIFPIMESETPVQEDYEYTHDYHEDLIQRARRLGHDIENLIREYEYGGAF